MPDSLKRVHDQVVRCKRCPRLVAWREESAANPPARYRGEHYWARPLPGFGDPHARLLVVGLAPAAHGGNRTGRIFTGDRSGDWLYRALYRAGFANQPRSVARDDGLELTDAWVNAIVRCAPPDNKPLPDERSNCIGYFTRELALLGEVRAILALGAFAWDGVLRAATEMGHRIKPRPKFGHGAVADVDHRWTMIGSYHPSQQNTFTGKLTEQMFDDVVALAAARART